MVTSVHSLSGVRGETALKLITDIAQPEAAKSKKNEEPTVKVGADTTVSDRTQSAISSITWDPNKKPSAEQVAKLVEYYSTHDEPMSYDAMMMIHCSDWAKVNLQGGQINQRVPSDMSMDEFKQLAKNVVRAQLTEAQKMLGDEDGSISKQLAALKNGNFEIYTNGEQSDLFGSASVESDWHNGAFRVSWNEDNVDQDVVQQKIKDGLGIAKSQIGGFAFTFTYW